jgi:predicted alpha/beta-fold hydrolase
VDDVLQAVEHVLQLCAGSPLTLIGFSLGAGMTLKLLGSRTEQIPPRLDSAIAVAPPLDLSACSRNMDRGWNRVYDRSFVRRLMALVQQRAHRDPRSARAPRRARSLYEFDTCFTAPAGGFRDVQQYYDSSSALPDLRAIRVPTRVLTAADDPLIPVDVFYHAGWAPSTRVTITDHGGHLGYIGAAARPSPPDADWHWMEWRIVRWVVSGADSYAATQAVPACRATG